MITMRPNRAGFQRLRTITQGLELSPADRNGPVLTVLNRVHVTQVKQAFATRGASVAGGPWPPWSKRYAEWRRRYRSRLGNRMMVLTHSLLEKSTHVSHGNYVGRWLGRMSYAFGFRDDVGFWHEHGIGLPVRSIIKKTASQYRDFVAAFVKFYRARIRQIARAVR